jgi:hypothetical protein
MPIYDPNVQTEAVNEIVTVIDHPDWTEPMQAPWFDQAANADIIIGGEQIPATGWTSADWTGNSVDGWDHTTGNTTTLLNSLAGVVDNLYLISLTVSGRTAGTFTVTFGGEVSIAIAATYSYSIKATTTGTLIVTPTTDFDGTIIISIKQVLWELTEAEILAILGVSDVVESSDLTGYVAVEAGKSLVSDTEILRLADIEQNVYTIDLPTAASVAGRISGATVPDGWVIVDSDVVNLLITHTLTNRKVAFVNVFEVDTPDERLSVPFMTAYTGILATGITVLVEGLNAIELPLRIELVFNKTVEPPS